MKILAIATICPVPGILAENDVILQFYKRLQEMYPEVEVKVLKPAVFATDFMVKFKPSLKALCETRKLDRFEVHGFPVQTVPFIYLSNESHIYHTLARTILLTNQKRIEEFLEGYDYDFIHAHYINMDGELARQLSKKSGKPYILSTQREEHRFRNKTERWNAQRIVESAAEVTSLSPFAAKKIAQCTERRSKVIPYGINDLFLDGKVERSTVSADKFKLITVGRLLTLKNIDIILLALGNLKGAFDFEFTVIGEGPDRVRLESMVNELGLAEKVQFKGFLEREVIRQQLSEHDLFVLPSAPETYGLVYPEAMSCGLPVICAKDNGFHGHFMEGECGISVVPRDIKDLERVLRHLFNNPEEIRCMSIAALQHSRAFSWNKCCESYMNVFKGILTSFALES